MTSDKFSVASSDDFIVASGCPLFCRSSNRFPDPRVVSADNCVLHADQSVFSVGRHVVSAHHRVASATPCGTKNISVLHVERNR